MSWSVDGRACTEVLSSSYEDLTLALKSCFMYFAMYPEDYDIFADDLMRMWVAEGFIPEEENRKLEDTAESFLEELVQRCMIQVSSRMYNDSIERCRIHDLLHDLAIQKAKEDNFLVVYSTEDDSTSCSDARRVAVHNRDCGELMEKASPSLRSLLCFDLIPDCSKQRLLKVLRTGIVEFRRLQRSTQLRYIKIMGGAMWNLSEDEYFKRVLCSMKFLQTLDLRGTIHGELPDCIWLVKSLRHVMLCDIDYTSGPSSGADLRNLQTLTGVKSRKSWATGAGTPKLSNLRELDIKVVEGLPWEVVFALLGTLKQLTYLTLILNSNDCTFKVPDMSDCTFGPHLQSLCLDLDLCPEIMSVGINMFSIHLIDLILNGLQLDQDPMSVLEKLQNLEILSIWELNYNKKQMRFSAKGFVRLHELNLVTINNLEELEIEEGAMPMLKNFYIYGCPQLRVPLGLQHLTSLESLRWNLSDDNLASAKKNEIRNLCKHVPTLNLD